VAPRRRRDGRRLITLTSDVGSAYTAQMKGALIAGGVDPSRVVDLAHDLPAHGVGEAAFLLRAMARTFPPESVHVAVVDPGVGGRRSAVVIATRAGPWLVGPDNGILMPLAHELGLRAAYRIDRIPGAARPRVGTTFDGRDLFAPAAAWLATGGHPPDLGPRTVPMAYDLPRPTRGTAEARGAVVHIDRFGNLITNIPSSWVGGTSHGVTIRVGRSRSRRVAWVTSYESLGRGTLGALGSSFGLVELAVGEGRAADRFGAGVGASVAVSWPRRPRPRGEKANSARPRKRP